MAARCLLVGKLSVPHFESKEMEIECKNIINKLKNESDQYFIDAKNIVYETLEDFKYNNIGVQETLKSNSFCEKFKENIVSNLNERGQKNEAKF